MLKKLKTKSNIASLILSNSYFLSKEEKEASINQAGNDYTNLSDQEIIEIAFKSKLSFSNTLLLILYKKYQDLLSDTRNPKDFIEFIQNLNQNEIENLHNLFQEHYFKEINLYVPVEKIHYQLKLFKTNESVLKYFPAYYDISLLKYDLSEIISKINMLITSENDLKKSGYYFSNTYKLNDLVIKRKGLSSNKKLNQKNIGKSLDSEKEPNSIHHAFLFDEKSGTVAKVFEYGKNHYFLTPEQIL